MQTSSFNAQTLYWLLRQYPTWLFAFTLAMALKRWNGTLSLSLGVSSKTFGYWSVHIERGKDALPKPKALP